MSHFYRMNIGLSIKIRYLCTHSTHIKMRHCTKISNMEIKRGYAYADL